MSLGSFRYQGRAGAGQNLEITPRLFAYNPDLGNVSISYTTNAINAVDMTDPDNPTLLINAVDEGTTITVTAAPATQGKNTTGSVSNGVAIPSGGDRLAMAAIDIQNESTSTATPSWTVDLSAYGGGDSATH